MKKAAPSGRKEGEPRRRKHQKRPAKCYEHLTGQATPRTHEKATAGLYHILLLADKYAIDKE